MVVFNPFTKKLDFTGTASATTTFKALQVLTPAPNGATTTFTTPDNFVASSITPVINGLAEHYFSVASANTITFSSAPVTGDDVRASYQVA